MISLLFILFTSLFFMLVVGAILSQLYKQKIAINRRTASYFDIGEGKRNTKPITKNDLVFLKKVSDKVKTVIDQKTPISKKYELELRLREAGYPLNLSSTDFKFFQLLIGFVIFFSLSLLLMKLDTTIFSSFFLAGLMAVIAMYYPSFYLSVIIKKRRIAIQKSMPDFFDMVNLSIEAGMGLDAALLKVSKNSKGPLSEEFLQTIEDMKLGKSRREAFYDLRKRVPVHQFQSIITSLIQADMLGVGMAKVIRSLTGRIREQRTQLAREQAMKAPVKMIFPMMFFIFPALFIVMLGPLVIYLIQTIL
ncbi:type II secretion system F family protein [Paenisporosarcina sp. TG20]|uniref:type II secretion system F family protein n=1 Tax=Paenisporosarcina sp. TG20 TaxID=1211706 RepID=UPI0003110AE1|nr:type II secretion system F family protein [Paenisporosarcina sp. TG20]